MSFWQRVQHGVTQAAAEASKQTTIARKNLEINGVRGDIRRKTGELGDAALLLYREGAIQHEGLAALVKEIDDLEAREAALRAEVTAADGKVEEADAPGAGQPAATDGAQPAAVPPTEPAAPTGPGAAQ